MQQVAHEPNHEQGLRVSKHIFVGNSRLVTALTHQAGVDTTEQAAKLYYYHADHLQSAQFITDANGEKYEHIEYTPYGELWIEETAPGVDKLPFRFTGKELDTETGLYYYGARYLDPKYSRWLSGDPAVGEYIPKAPIDAEAKKHNENLPGMGGVFNVVNLHVYHYAGNNPVKYIDPDGESATSTVVGWIGTDIATPEPTDTVLWKWVGYGVVIVGAVVIDYFAAKTVSKASAKAKEQTEQEQTPDANAIRFQVQVGSETSASVVKTSQDKKFGVKKAHAYEALMELYTSAVSKEPGL